MARTVQGRRGVIRSIHPRPGRTKRTFRHLHFRDHGWVQTLEHDSNIPADTLKLPVEEQLAALPELMQGYLREYRGACPFFGMVTGFLYVRLRGYYQFGRDCQFVGYIEKPFRRGHVVISLH